MLCVFILKAGHKMWETGAGDWEGGEESLCPEASSLHLAVPPNHLSAVNTGLESAQDSR